MSLESLLDQSEIRMRTNIRNDGRGFESEIEQTNLAYERRGIASLNKVVPPMRVLGGGKRVIFMKNPYLDFLGTWTAQHGRAIFVEVKSTSDRRLRFNSTGGFNIDQWNSMKRWRRAGAACCLLWESIRMVSLWTPEMLLEREIAEDRSLSFDSGLLVERGLGNILWDYLPVLERAVWGAKNSSKQLL